MTLFMAGVNAGFCVVVLLTMAWGPPPADWFWAILFGLSAAWLWFLSRKGNNQ